jgi:hypothetical protein
MTQHIVHIYREMKLTFGGIEAESQEAAAHIARNLATDEADGIDDCDGETLAALVDVIGDDDYHQSRIIDFETERMRKAAPLLLAALEYALEYLKANDDGEEDIVARISAASSAIAEARAASSNNFMEAMSTQ